MILQLEFNLMIIISFAYMYWKNMSLSENAFIKKFRDFLNKYQLFYLLSTYVLLLVYQTCLKQ